MKSTGQSSSIIERDWWMTSSICTRRRLTSSLSLVSMVKEQYSKPLGHRVELVDAQIYQVLCEFSAESADVGEFVTARDVQQSIVELLPQISFLHKPGE